MLKQTKTSKTKNVILFLRNQTTKLTSWYRGIQKPRRPGVYERKFVHGMIQYSKWTGEYWCVGDESLWRASHRIQKSEHQQRPWRGLTHDD